MDLTKPNIVTIEDLHLDLIQQLRDQGQEPEARLLEDKLVAKDPLNAAKIVSHKTELHLKDYLDPKNPKVAALLRDIRILSVGLISDPVLIQGETGTGKEMLAHALHGRRDGKFIAVNCTSLPSELIESELFGHKKGAFTSADADRIGKIQAAHNGTLFLDEIGDMPIDMQTKLLRVLQDKKVCRLGGNEEIDVKFRLVCATNRNVGEMIKSGTFREDLYYRLSVFCVHTIPLRDRPEDIPVIVRSLDVNGDFPAEFDWLVETNGLRGNVRQIQAIVRRWQLLRKTIV